MTLYETWKQKRNRRAVHRMASDEDDSTAVWFLKNLTPWAWWR